MVTVFLMIICLSCKNTKQVVQNEKPKVAYLAAYMKAKDVKHMYYAIATPVAIPLYIVLNFNKPLL